MKNTLLKETGREEWDWVWVPVEEEVMCARGRAWQMWAILHSQANSTEKRLAAAVRRACSSWGSPRRCSVPVLWKVCTIPFWGHGQVHAFCVRNQPQNWTHVQAAKGGGLEYCSSEWATVVCLKNTSTKFGRRHWMFSHYENSFTTMFSHCLCPYIHT